MKICYFANAGSIHTYRWVTYFAKQGHEISIISLKKSTFNYKGINVFVLKRIKSTPKFSSHLINVLPFILQLLKLKRQIKPDVFHALGSSNGLLATIVGFKPLILTIADPGIFEIPHQRKLSKLDKILNRYAIEKANLLVCDGENTQEAMIKLGANPYKIRMIRYGVDTEKFKPFKVVKENQTVISTKPLRSESDVATLIKAIPDVLKRFPKTKFIIVGDGDQKENLISLAKSLKVYEAITFTGNVPSDTIPLYLNSADVFVGTSLVDTGLAASTAEAMACGLPIVVSDSGDNSIWIKSGKNGFIFPLKDFQSLSEEIIHLLGNEGLRTRFCKANIEMIREMNDYQKEMKKMEKIYKGFSSLDHPHRPMLIEEINTFQPQSVLEIGCGYGPNLFWLSKKLPNAKIEGIDINPKEIEKGIEYLEESSIYSTEFIRLSVGSANCLQQFKDKSFDVVFTDAVLMYINPDEIKRVIQEMIRITKKAIIIVDWYSKGPDTYNSHIGNWTRDYQALLKQFISEEQIEIVKIKEEWWPNEDWQKFGYIIKVKL